jgi:hypothetical protein
MTLMLFSLAWGMMVHEKNLKQKFHDTAPLKIKYWQNLCMPEKRDLERGGR